MKPIINHPWNINEEEAIDLQQRLASFVERNDRIGDIKTVAGVDVAYAKNSNKLIAAAVVIDFNSLNVIQKIVVEDTVQFPYIPGLFSFRELPAIAKSLELLQITPDLIICDGQGIAHPRRFGLACHVGVTFDIPTIGCGKNILLGTHDEVGEIKGDYSPVFDNGEIIANALRTRDNVKPLYLSTGHRVALCKASKIILNLCRKYRLPETTRISNSIVQSLINTN
jgi:deoxyribonuclease V